MIQSDTAEYERGGDGIIQIWLAKASIINGDSRKGRFYLFKVSLIISSNKSGMSLNNRPCLNDLNRS